MENCTKKHQTFNKLIELIIQFLMINIPFQLPIVGFLEGGVENSYYIIMSDNCILWVESLLSAECNKKRLIF